MRHAQVQALLGEAVGPAEAAELAEVLGPLTDLVSSAPAASAELRALFDSGCAGSSDEATANDSFCPRPRGSSTLAGVVLALAGVGATGLSAAANTLPGPLQHHVSTFSAHYLPFQFPDPQAGVPRTVRPSPDALGPPASGRELRLDVDSDATTTVVWRALSLVRSDSAGHWATSDLPPGQGADRRDDASAYSPPSSAKGPDTEPERTIGPDDAHSSPGFGQASDDTHSSASKRDDRERVEKGKPQKNRGGSKRSSPSEEPRHPSAAASDVGKDKPLDRDRDAAKAGGGIDEDADGLGGGAPTDRLDDEVARGTDPAPFEDAPAPDPGDAGPG